MKWIYENIGNLSVDLSSYVSGSTFHTIDMRPFRVAMPQNQAGLANWECLQGCYLFIRTSPSSPAGGTSCAISPKALWDSGAGTQSPRNCNIDQLGSTTGGTSQTLSTTLVETFRVWNDHIYNAMKIIAPQVRITFTHDRTSGSYAVDYLIGVD